VVRYFQFSIAYVDFFMQSSEAAGEDGVLFDVDRAGEGCKGESDRLVG